VELQDAVRARRAIRRFLPDPVDRAVLEDLVEAATLAPSAGNEQPWRFHVATGSARNKIVELMTHTSVFVDEYMGFLEPDQLEAVTRFWTNLGDAPVVVAVTIPLADDELTKLNYCLSTGAAVENFMLAATDRGLGTCTVTFSFWVRDEIAEALDVEATRRIVSLVLLGKPAEHPERPSRRTDLATYLD